MRENSVIQNLSNIWCRAVKEGKIINTFETPNGDRIEFGVTLQDGKPGYYAKNVTTGVEFVAQVKEEQIQPHGFYIQYNGYHALRPGRKIEAVGRKADISADAAQCGFKCQDPQYPASMLRRDPLMQVNLPNFRWNCYYNQLPVDPDGHFLWLPVRVNGCNTTIPHLKQELTFELFEDILELFNSSQRLIFFFNSMHAGASVHHLHFQAQPHKKILAIESVPRNCHRQKGGVRLGVSENYPAYGYVFDRDTKIEHMWYSIAGLNKNKIPFSLIFIGNRICLLPRNPEHEVVSELPAGAITCMALAGQIMVLDEFTYDRMDYATIQRAFQKTTVAFA